MGRTKVLGRRPRGETMPVGSPSLSQVRTTLPPYQTRICARCGHNTTFVLEDAAGGWYSCVECGRYA
jgi:hypothetical protein